MKKSKIEIIKQIADLDVIYNQQMFYRTMTAEQLRKLRVKRERLEKELYR